MKNDVLVRFINTTKSASEIERVVNDFLIDEKEGDLCTSSYGFSLVRKKTSGELETEHQFLPLSDRPALQEYVRQGLHGKWEVELDLITLLELSPMIYSEDNRTSLFFWVSESVSDGYASRLLAGDEEIRNEFESLIGELAVRVGTTTFIYTNFADADFAALEDAKALCDAKGKIVNVSESP